MTMHLAAFSSAKLIQEKLKFWDDVHGFNMEHDHGLVGRSVCRRAGGRRGGVRLVCVCGSRSAGVTAKTAEPQSDFSLTLTSDVDEVHGFISWFDTFFLPTPRVPADAPSDCPNFSLTEKDVVGLALKGNAVTEVKATQGKGETVAFSTSPHSKETHWQQTLFVLKTAITGVRKGDTIKGRIVVLQDQKHSRQLEVELHYLHVPQHKPESGKRRSRRSWCRCLWFARPSNSIDNEPNAKAMLKINLGRPQTVLPNMLKATPHRPQHLLDTTPPSVLTRPIPPAP